MTFQDERTEQEKAATTGFIVCYSDFGDYRTKIARPIKEENEYDVISEVMKGRSDLKRVDYAFGKETPEGRIYKPRLKEGERVYIHNFNSFLPHGGHCAHVGGRVSYAPMRGKIKESTELAHGVTVVVTEKERGLLLGEWRVSELLPVRLHARDNLWQAWVLGGAMMEQALRLLGIVVTSEYDKIVQEITIPNTSPYYDKALRLWREIYEAKREAEGAPSLAYVHARVLSNRNTEHTYMKALRLWHQFITD